MDLKHQIEARRDDPEGLEVLYRTSPELFARQFESVFEAHPSSPILHAWHARLSYEKPVTQRAKSGFLQQPSEILLVVLLCLIGGTLVKVSELFGLVDQEAYILRNLSFFVMPWVAGYFLVRNRVNTTMYIGLGLIFLGGAMYMNLIPYSSNSDAVQLAVLHLPFLLWTIVGIAYAGIRYRELEPRMDYLKFNGEMLVYSVILGIGGMAMTGITIALFSAIGVHIEEWYLSNVVVYGLVSIPIVASYITVHRAETGQRIAPAIARIFSPLVLITLVAFLVANALQGKSPYTDRDFLIVFNIMLIGVLAITIFTISERASTTAIQTSDYIVFALVVVALIVDLIALSAIVFRLSSFGLTPNRLAVLGANLLVFGNLAGILYYYGRFMRGRAGMDRVERWITRYLPLYTVWTAFIVFGLPLFFGFA